MCCCWGHFQKTCKNNVKRCLFWGHFQKTYEKQIKMNCFGVCEHLVPRHVGPRTTFSICDDIYNQVPRASNHMHLVQLSLLYIPKGIRLKGNSFYKIQNRDGTRRRPRTKPKALNPLPFTCPGTSITTVPKPHSDQ